MSQGCVLSNHFLGGWRHGEDTMVAALLTFNDKLLPYTELKVREVLPWIKVLMLYMYINVYLHMGIATCGHQVEGEESQTAEEINVRALLPKD